MTIYIHALQFNPTIKFNSTMHQFDASIRRFSSMRRVRRAARVAAQQLFTNTTGRLSLVREHPEGVLWCEDPYIYIYVHIYKEKKAGCSLKLNKSINQ